MEGPERLPGSPDDWEGLRDWSWLWPEEQIVWTGRDRFRGYPLLRILAVAGILLAAYLASVAFGNGPGSTTPIAVPFVVFAAMVVIVASVVGTRAVERHRSLDRYLLTDRRAVVVRVPGKVIGQAGVLTPDLRARLAWDGRGGNVDWGRSDLMRDRQRSLQILQSFAWYLGISDPDRVRFEHLVAIEPLMVASRRIRSRWGVETYAPDKFLSRGPVPTPLGFLDSGNARILNRISCIVGCVALAVALLLLLLTYVPGDALFGFAPVGVLFALNFPIFGWGVLVLLGRQQRPGDPFRTHAGVGAMRLPYLPLWAMALGVAIIVLAGVVGSHTSGQLPGQPEYNVVSHRYTYDSHGATVTISKTRYEALVKIQNRLFLTGVLVFTTLGTGIAVDELIRQRKRPHRPGR